MREQDFIAERPKRSGGPLLVSSRVPGAAAAAAASASGLATLAFVLAVLPPVPGPGVMAAVAEGLRTVTLA